MSRKVCTILSENDLLPENIKTTVKTIECNPNKFYLLAAGGQKALWEVVEELSKSVEDDNTLTKLRIAYNLQFKLPTFLNSDNSAGIEVKNFADLLEHLVFDENLNLTRADYQVIINDDDDAAAANRAVNELYQQSVFLWINGLDIRKKSDMRPIRIVVMGTKKAGKSVLIKNFIQGDYAPTGSVLPTPCTIKYVPDKKLFLEYDGKIYNFPTAEELHEFICGEFKTVQQKSLDANLPDMTIHYPCNGRGYEIWDMPGPNVVYRDESIQKIKKIIETVDVCIFVMNYNKAITTDEVKFLMDIRETVKDKAFIVAVNRIDERYCVNEDKSVARILDYISCRFKDLGYKKLIVFGTGALQNFYLDKVVELADREGLPVDSDSIRPLRRKYREYSPQIKFIFDAFGNLEDFHDIDNPTDKELRTFSGIPQLIRYVNYLGEQVHHKN